MSILSNLFGKKNTAAKNVKFCIGQKVQLKPNHYGYEEYLNVVTCFEIFRKTETGYELYHPALYNKEVGEFFLLGNDNDLDIYTIYIQD
jgi:hypothetical protein